jgi:aldehyde:ferredoxin oxidoreductase
MTEPIPTGSIAGWKMERKDYGILLDEYYGLHNWDKETSFPTRECLEDLERVGKLR